MPLPEAERVDTGALEKPRRCLVKILRESLSARRRIEGSQYSTGSRREYNTSSWRRMLTHNSALAQTPHPPLAILILNCIAHGRLTTVTTRAVMTWVVAIIRIEASERSDMREP
jgi:hypothetical protein